MHANGHSLPFAVIKLFIGMWLLENDGYWHVYLTSKLFIATFLATKEHSINLRLVNTI